MTMTRWPLQSDFLSSLNRALAVFVLCGLLLSCGFHLRGAYSLPESMALTHIEAGKPNSELVRQLKRSLRASDIHLVDKQDQATGILSITEEKQNKRVLSVDDQGGHANTSCPMK